MKASYDIVVIGFGKAGKTLAAKFSKAGKSVALIEKDKNMYGGTCINVGCIPSKRLITDASKSPNGEFEEKAQHYKEAVAEKKKLTAALNKANYDKIAGAGVDIIDGMASFKDDHHIIVSKGLATGKDEIKHLHEITGFIGQVYSIKNTHSLKENLRIIPTKHFLNIKTQGGYLSNMSGGKKINVDNIWQNNHYNIYCTDEQSARMFLTPALIDLFNNYTSDCGLSLYSNESRIYIAAYNNKRLFAAPKNKDSLRSWSIEKAASNIKYAITFAEKIAEIM